MLSNIFDIMGVDTIWGGWLSIDHENKKIKAYAISGNFWTVSNELVEWMFEDYIKMWYTVDIDMDNQWSFFESQE